MQENNEYVANKLSEISHNIGYLQQNIQQQISNIQGQVNDINRTIIDMNMENAGFKVHLENLKTTIGKLEESTDQLFELETSVSNTIILMNRMEESLTHKLNEMTADIKGLKDTIQELPNLYQKKAPHYTMIDWIKTMPSIIAIGALLLTLLGMWIKSGM